MRLGLERLHFDGLAICLVAMSSLPAFPSSGWTEGQVRDAGYKMEHVAGIWQDGYLDGPAKGAMFEGASISEDAAGNIYVMDVTRVRVIDRNNRVWTIAGNGIRGFRDGPADEAMFNIGGRGYNYANIGVDSKGNIYIPDGYNDRIRKVFRREDGRWSVETFAGGGATRLRPGQTGKALDLQIANPVSLAVDAYDNVWTEAWCCIYKITPAGETFSYENKADNAVYMQADKKGNVYLLVRENWASHYWRVTQNGDMKRIAGMTEKEVKQVRKSKAPLPVDGPAMEATFWSHSSFGVSDDGKRIYGGNGDEHVVRRIWDDVSMTLFDDGWRIEEKDRKNGWFIGGPVLVGLAGQIYVTGNNPPAFLKFRKLIPLK